MGKMKVAKRCVFRRRLRVSSVSDAVMLDGKVFQVCGAVTVTKHARSPCRMCVHNI